MVGHAVQSLTRGQKVQSRREREIFFSFLQFWEEKEKPEIPFPSFERRKRYLKKWFSICEKRKRKGFSFIKFREETENFVNKSPISRREREIWNSFPQFWEEKEKFGKGSPLWRREREMDIIFSRFERRKRIPTRLFEKFSLSAKLLAAMQCINHGNYVYMSDHPHVWRRLY